MSQGPPFTYLFYDGVLQRLNSQLGTEAFLDGEWMGITPSEEEWNRRREISEAEGERILGEEDVPDLPVTYFRLGDSLYRLKGSWEPGFGRLTRYDGEGAWFLPPSKERKELESTPSAEIDVADFERLIAQAEGRGPGRSADR